MEKGETNLSDLVPRVYEEHKGKLIAIQWLLMQFYDETQHNLYNQWERVSIIGKLAVELLFKYDILPHLEKDSLTHINIVVPLRGGVPFFDAHVASHLLELVRSAGFNNTRINYIPIGMKRDSLSIRTNIYYVPLEYLDGLKDQKSIWVVWDFGVATGQTVADVAQYLIEYLNIHSTNIILRSGLVTERGAKYVFDKTGIPLYGFIRCKTGKEVGCFSSKENTWIVEIEGELVSPRDWRERTIGMRGGEKPRTAKENLERLFNKMIRIYNVLSNQCISQIDIELLEYYYWRMYQLERLKTIGPLKFVEEMKTYDLWEGYRGFVPLLIRGLVAR